MNQAKLVGYLQKMNQKQIQTGSIEIKEYDDAYALPKLWYENDQRVAAKVSSTETFASFASALRNLIQGKTDEMAANVSMFTSNNTTNNTRMQHLSKMQTSVSIVDFAFEGEKISADSGAVLSSVVSSGTVFQANVEYSIQFGGGDPMNGSAQGQTSTMMGGVNQYNTVNAGPVVGGEGPITAGGGGCCVIL